MNGKVLLLIALLCVPLAATAQKAKIPKPPNQIACRHLADVFAKVGKRMALGDMLQLRNCLTRILAEKGRKELGALRGSRRGPPHPRLTPLRPRGAPVPGHPGIRIPKGQQPAMPPGAHPPKPGAPATPPAPEAPHN